MTKTDNGQQRRNVITTVVILFLTVAALFLFSLVRH